MPTRRPRFLVASSREGLDVARKLQRKLESDVELILWNEGFFTAGQLTLETLESAARNYDGAVVVATADDTVLSRDVEFNGVRDNVLFEFGIFISMFGRRKALLLVEETEKTKVPSDIHGLTYIGFSRGEVQEVSLSDAAQKLKVAVLNATKDPLDPFVMRGLEDITKAYLADFQTALGCLSGVGVHVWVVDERSDPPALVRVARNRTTPKAAIPRVFAKGEGIVGRCWETGDDVFVDFTEDVYNCSSRSKWAKVDDSRRCGMDFDLLVSGRKRYRLIGAAPVVSTLSSNQEFLGCVSYNAGEVVGLVNRQKLNAVLYQLCEMVRIILEMSSRTRIFSRDG